MFYTNNSVIKHTMDSGVISQQVHLEQWADAFEQQLLKYLS